MRQVCRLLDLVRRYGPGPVDAACAGALELYRDLELGTDFDRPSKNAAETSGSTASP